jgi:hypothetical protein
MSFNGPSVSSTSLDINRVEIVIDEDFPERVEIHMLDESGNRVEGGTFDKAAFMNAVLEFYDRNF